MSKLGFIRCSFHLYSKLFTKFKIFRKVLPFYSVLNSKCSVRGGTLFNEDLDWLNFSLKATNLWLLFCLCVETSHLVLSSCALILQSDYHVDFLLKRNIPDTRLMTERSSKLKDIRQVISCSKCCCLLWLLGLWNIKPSSCHKGDAFPLILKNEAD